MEKIAAQLEILRRVLGEIQDASQDDLALEVVPIVKKLDDLDLGTHFRLSFHAFHLRSKLLRYREPLFLCFAVFSFLLCYPCHVAMFSDIAVAFYLIFLR